MMNLRLSLLRFSLADKISLTIIVVGLIGILLVYYLTTSYIQFAYQHHTQSIQQLAYLEIDDLIDDLKSNSIELALAIEQEKEFTGDFQNNRISNITQTLNNQFYQYFVTAGIIKLLKLYVLDTDSSLRGFSSKGIATDTESELVCPQLGQSAQNRKGTEKLKPFSGMCTHMNHPAYVVIVPFGGLNPKGYLQVITDLAYGVKKIEQSLAMPMQIHSISGELIYQSEDWKFSPRSRDYINIELPITDANDEPVMTITLKSDMQAFNKEIKEYRNHIMSIAFLTTAFTVYFVLMLLRRSTIVPLAKIHDVLEKISLKPKSKQGEGRLLFEQLLEQIIRLRQKSRNGFSVMILDLTNFSKINKDHGHAVGDQLLYEVEQCLGSTLRETDLISWVGTDTPGHKLLPSDRKTQYRATIARLGGDEFGLLLPSAQTAEQAHSVARRIVETLNRPFLIQDIEITIGCKIGISIYPVHGEDEKLLIRNADKAMHRAKEIEQMVLVYEK